MIYEIIERSTLNIDQLTNGQTLCYLVRIYSISRKVNLNGSFMKIS